LYTTHCLRRLSSADYNIAAPRKFLPKLFHSLHHVSFAAPHLPSLGSLANYHPPELDHQLNIPLNAKARALMDRYLAPHTPEAKAHNFITYVLFPAPFSPLATPVLTVYAATSHSENIHWEDEEQSHLNEQLIALCASYTALARYIKGADIYIHPRSFAELESKL
jgi:hypothetical protein